MQICKLVWESLYSSLNPNKERTKPTTTKEAVEHQNIRKESSHSTLKQGLIKLPQSVAPKRKNLREKQSLLISQI